MLRRLIAVTPSLLWIACNFGKVEQGRVVRFDREPGLATVVPASGYGEVTVRVPADRAEMGPEPEPGGLVSVDTTKRQIVAYDTAAARLRSLPYTPVEERRNVSRSDSSVRRLPSIDRTKGTVTLYEPRQRLLLTVALSPEHLALPPETWRAGDEVRYYYKDPTRALRMMNVTRTDITRAAH